MSLFYKTARPANRKLTSTCLERETDTNFHRNRRWIETELSVPPIPPTPKGAVSAKEGRFLNQECKWFYVTS